MIRFIILTSVLTFLYLTYLYWRDKEFGYKNRIRAVITVAIVIVGSLVAVVLKEYQQRSLLDEQMLAQGFKESDNQVYSRAIDGIKVRVRYESGYTKEESATRLNISLIFPFPFNGLREMFCTEREFSDYEDKNSTIWYPTPEIKLSNGHYVGRCYPVDKIEKIKRLPTRTNQFKPMHVRYLFLPTITQENSHLLEIYTENIDASDLLLQLDDFLHYYRLLAE